MKANDYFKRALSLYMKDHKLTQAMLADSVGFARTQLSDFMNDRRGFSEERKEQIAVFLGTTYVEMLVFGRDLCEGDLPAEKESSVPGIFKEKQESSQSLESLIDKMQWMIDALGADVERKVEYIENLKEDIKDYRKDLDEYKKDIHDYREEIKKLREKNSELAKELSGQKSGSAASKEAS